MSDGSGIKRREFLKVVGAGSAGVAAASCSPSPRGGANRLIPYVIPAEEIVPGMPTYYASTCQECPAGCGILVETHEGRVTKVEGNPAQPISRGNLCARGQASVQGLYHPDRYQGPSISEDGIGFRDVAWLTAERVLAQRIQQARPGAVAFLTGTYGPSLDQLVNSWVGAMGARRVVYDPWANQPRNLNFADADYLIAFGADFLETWGSPVDYAWQFAQMHSYRNGRKGKFVWVGPHRPLTGLNADEWIASQPGTEHLVAMALAGTTDAAAAAQQAGVPTETLTRIGQEFRAGRGVALGPGVAIAGRNAQMLQQAVNQLNGAAAQAQPPATTPQLLQLIEQMRAGQIDVLLIDAPNPAYTLPGAVRFAEAMRNVRTRVSFATFPDDTASLCNLILPGHHFLESWGDYSPRPDVVALIQPAMRPVFNTRQVGDVLIGSMRALGVGTVAQNSFYDVLRGNWGGDAAWREALRNGGSFAASPTAGLPQGTGFMGMQDAQRPQAQAPAAPAEASPLVPLAAPAARPQQQVPGQPPLQQQPLQQPPDQQPGIQQPPAEQQPLQQPGVQQPGVQQPGVQQPGVQQPPVTEPPAGLVPDPAGTGAGQVGVGIGAPTFEEAEGANFFLVVYPSYRFFDGRSANRPWLLELPDPVTKVSWHSWIEIHPQAAERLGVRQGEILEVASPYGRVEGFAYLYPGVREDTIAIQTGLGHTAFGRFTAGRGINPNHLLGPTLDEAGNLAPYGLRVAVQRARGKPRPGPDALFEQGVRVQYDRDLSQAVSVATLVRQEQTEQPSVPGEQPIHLLKAAAGFGAVPTRTDPAAFPPPGTRFGEYHDGWPRWAMVVDLDRCIGCSACVIACNAENNIPVVGPDEMRKGRELHWLRIERYWGVSRNPREAMTTEATNDTRFLPMLCQHCNNAPCEPVCPVYAAYHTPDGLNAQIYNRCVGTRYCANNCPWKVRVFNWFTYEFHTPLNWQLNPDVTVREKGVMEKCTFCVQRIHEARRNAARAERLVEDGEIAPACVQTCPTEVFVFGDIKDPTSAVARAARSHRSYRTLEEVNAQPAIVYLQKVTHHEPAWGSFHAPAQAQPYTAEPAAH
jgi:anaerobic selenocysteine-containing dehydrogenase/Fe-S-cluster-containing dehydrogenase component